MPNSIDPIAQHKRRREAWLSVLAATGILLLTGGVFLALGCCLPVPVWKLLHIRLQEIEGGEEDAARQY